MRRLIGSMTCWKYVACWGLLCVCWWGHACAANALEEAAPTLAIDANEPEGPILVGYEATNDEPTSAFEPASHAAEPLPTPATPRPASELKPVSATATAPVVTDVIMLIDATHSMAWPSGRERRMAIAQWSALDVADGIPENIPAAFVALHDEATALRQLLPLTNDGRGHLRRTVMRLVPAGEGKLDKLLVEARRLLTGKPDAVPLIVLVTDGVDCDPFSHGAPIRDRPEPMAIDFTFR